MSIWKHVDFNVSDQYIERWAHVCRTSELSENGVNLSRFLFKYIFSYTVRFLLISIFDSKQFFPLSHFYWRTFFSSFFKIVFYWYLNKTELYVLLLCFYKSVEMMGCSKVTPSAAKNCASRRSSRPHRSLGIILRCSPRPTHMVFNLHFLGCNSAGWVHAHHGPVGCRYALYHSA